MTGIDAFPEDVYITNGVSRLQTNEPDSTCRPSCHGHTLPPSWSKACHPARSGGVYDHHHRVYHSLILRGRRADGRQPQTPRGPSMPVLSYIHQLFNAEHCQAYIHMLRWQERPLQCPRCQSQDVDPWGQYHYRPGCKRYWCHGCQRTFNDLTHTLLHQSRRSLPHWILATFLLCLSCSSRRIARELGGHGRTSYRWCWWLRNTAVSYETDRQLEGTVEADDLYHTAGSKGQAKGGGKKLLGRRARGRRKKREPGRGPYAKDRPAIIAWVSRQGAVVIHATRDFTVKTVQKAANL